MKRDGAVSRRSVKRPRAQRFEVRTSIFYRRSGAVEWHIGMIENVSSSGVLLRTEHGIGPGTALEMKFTLPVELGGEEGALVACRGVVVRAPAGVINSVTVMVASTIHHAKLVHHGVVRTGSRAYA